MSALFESDGGFGDIANLFVEEHGEGAVMDSLRSVLTFREWQKQEEHQRIYHQIAARVSAERERRRICGDVAMLPDFEVPDFLYEHYKAEARALAARENMVLPRDGAEIFDDPDFKAYYRRTHWEMCYDEAPRNARIIVNPHGKFAAA